jgi:predicted ATPase
MKITIKNLGPIKAAEINFNKDLVIITGPNNTGKSYLSYLLYAIHDFRALVNSPNGLAEYIDKSFQDEDLLTHVYRDNMIVLRDIIASGKHEINSIISDLISSNLVKIFASSTIKPSILIDIEDVILKYNYNDISGIKIINSEVHLLWGEELDLEDEAISRSFSPEELLQYCSTMLLEYLKDHDLFGQAFMLPAERTALNLFSRDIIAKKAGSRDDMALRVLSGEDINEIARSIKKEQNNSPKYPFAINNYINYVNNFEGTNTPGEFFELAQDLESTILGGKISVSEFKQLLYRPQGSKNNLNLHESSSLVKSLSYLVVYLRYHAKKGELIIIDEPEINLHPNLQIVIAKIFAKMINAGLKLILSTHSDYLIKELNNLLLLGELNRKKKHKTFVKERGYDNKSLLVKSRVGAYFLNNGTINPIDLEENGLVVPTINEAIHRVDGLAEEIYMEMEG